MSSSHEPAIRSLLDFYIASGVDCALDENATDWLAEGERVQADAFSSPVVAKPLGVVKPPSFSLPFAASSVEAASGAREQAAKAQTLEGLERLLASFEGCALKPMAKNLVFADGNPQARIMLIGEAPGADEDRIGRPFMGRSGKLLDKMLAAIGLDRTSVYIANVVPWRPPGNRTPTPQEIAICRPFIERQIELADPDFLVCLGGPATQTLLGIKDGILKTRGRWFPYRSTREICALATLHPAYLLRQPLQKRLAWRDFLALKTALRE